MAWTGITRPKYRREGLRYASDTVGQEWAVIAPHLPVPSRRGQPRTSDPRAVVEAIFYSAGVIDSQSDKTAETGRQPTRKKIKGSERHILTDTAGPLIAAIAHDAGFRTAMVPLRCRVPSAAPSLVAACLRRYAYAGGKLAVTGC